MKQLLVMTLGVLVLAGCGGDDEKKDQPTDSHCPEGGDAGAEVACSCGDAGMTGTAICQANGLPGMCDCDGAGGSGGSGGTGGSGGSSTGSGGSGGSAGDGDGDGDDDGGMEPGDGDGDGDASVPLDLPDDGNQASVCVDDRDCNRGLGCYNAGFEGQGFCSGVCEADTDCEAIAGASYTCSMSSGLCIVECEGEDDAESCPEPMVCTNTGFGGGGGGGESFRCKYPGEAAPVEMAGLLEPCSLIVPCEEGLLCNPTGAGVNGFCTVECSGAEDDCSELEGGAGDATPECTNLPGPAGGERCTLDCSGAQDGCPGDMTCISFGPMSRCGYE